MKTLLLEKLNEETEVYISNFLNVYEHASETFYYFGLNVNDFKGNYEGILQEISRIQDELKNRLDALPMTLPELREEKANRGRIHRSEIQDSINSIMKTFSKSNSLFKYVNNKNKYFNIASLIEKTDDVIAEFTNDLFALNRIMYFADLIKQEEKGDLTEEKIFQMVSEINSEHKNRYKIHQLCNDYLIYDSNKMRVFEVTNVADYIKCLTTNFNDAKDECLFYRGHGDVKWASIPSIYRSNEVKYEHLLFNEMIVKHPEDFGNSMTTFEKLTKMQHYELPTRLLDVTTNPLVALYFACKEMNEASAEILIYKVKNDKIHYHDSSEVALISNLTRVNTAFNLDEMLKRSKDEMEIFCKEPLVMKLLNLSNNDSTNIQIDSADVLKSTLFVKAKLENKRIRAQHGAFILFGIDENKYIPSKLDYPYIKNRKHYRIIIPNEYKLPINNELQMLDINYSTIFPELDKSAFYIRENLKSL